MAYYTPQQLMVIDWNLNVLIDKFAAAFFGVCVDEMDLGLLHPFAVYFTPMFGELATLLAEYLGVDLYDLDENTEFLLFTVLHTALYMEVAVHRDDEFTQPDQFCFYEMNTVWFSCNGLNCEPLPAALYFRCLFCYSYSLLCEQLLVHFRRKVIVMCWPWR